MAVVVGVPAAEDGSDWPPQRPPANWNPADPINIANVRSFVGTRWKALWCEERRNVKISKRGVRRCTFTTLFQMTSR